MMTPAPPLSGNNKGLLPVFKQTPAPMTDTADRADVLLALERRIDAYRLVALNEGWNHNLAHAYGHKEYVAHRIAAIDASAERTIASGYDAGGYLRDHSGLATQKETADDG